MSFAEQMESLKGFDVNDLDFNTAGSWPGPIKVIVLVLVFALILGAGYWFAIKDQYTALVRAESEESTLKEQYRSKAFKVANLDAYIEQMKEMEESFGALLKQLPADTEVPGLLEDITNTGLGTGLQIDRIGLQPEVSRDFYVELPIEIDVRGTYHDLASFVSGVASLPRIVTLHEFSIKPVGQEVDDLVMEISAKTYRYNPDQGESGKKRKKK